MKKIVNILLILVFFQISAAFDNIDDIKLKDNELVAEVAFESLDRIEKALYDFREL